MKFCKEFSKDISDNTPDEHIDEDHLRSFLKFTCVFVRKDTSGGRSVLQDSTSNLYCSRTLRYKQTDWRNRQSERQSHRLTNMEHRTLQVLFVHLLLRD